MTVEQFTLLAMLNKEEADIDVTSIVELEESVFYDVLLMFTHDASAPPHQINLNLMAKFNDSVYVFDHYKFKDFYFNIYYGAKGSPIMFSLWGNVMCQVVMKIL